MSVSTSITGSMATQAMGARWVVLLARCGAVTATELGDLMSHQQGALLLLLLLLHAP